MLKGRTSGRRGVKRFKVKTLKRKMSDQIDEGLRSELQRQGIWVTSMQELYNWGRKNSIWPLQFGLACCAIEMIATAASRYDIAPVRRRSLPTVAAPGRPDDRGRHGDQENGAANRAPLQPDARSEIRHLHGRLRNFRRTIQSKVTMCSKESTVTFQSMFTFPVARRGPKRCCTRSWNYSARSTIRN